MSIVVRKTKMKLTYREGKPEVYKMRQLTYQPLTFEQLLSEIQVVGVNPAQTQAVVTALLNRMVQYLNLGHAVQLDNFGTFKVCTKWKVAHTLEECTADTNVVKNLRFYPCKALQTLLREQTLKVNEAVSEQEPDSGGGDDDGDGE